MTDEDFLELAEAECAARDRRDQLAAQNTWGLKLAEAAILSAKFNEACSRAANLGNRLRNEGSLTRFAFQMTRIEVQLHRGHADEWVSGQEIEGGVILDWAPEGMHQEVGDDQIADRRPLEG